MLRDFYYSDDRRVESAILSLEGASSAMDQAAKLPFVRSAQKFFSEDRDRVFEAKLQAVMDESARLLEFQQQLEKEAGGKISLFGLSVNDMAREQCIVNGMSKRADKVKSDFKVPDRRYGLVPQVACVDRNQGPRKPECFLKDNEKSDRL